MTTGKAPTSKKTASNMKSTDSGAYNMPQKLLRVRVDQLRFHKTREEALAAKRADPFWLGERRGYTPSLEIHRIWTIQYHERLLSKSREANPQEV